MINRSPEVRRSLGLHRQELLQRRKLAVHLHKEPQPQVEGALHHRQGPEQLLVHKLQAQLLLDSPFVLQLSANYFQSSNFRLAESA